MMANKVQIDTHIIASALASYKLKQEENIKYWRRAIADAEREGSRTEYFTQMGKDARQELDKVEGLLNIFQANGGCLADYNFYAERKDRW